VVSTHLEKISPSNWIIDWGENKQIFELPPPRKDQILPMITTERRASGLTAPESSQGIQQGVGS